MPYGKDTAMGAPRARAAAPAADPRNPGSFAIFKLFNVREFGAAH